MQETFYTIPGCPVRIAQVSDLHERPYDAVLASLEKQRPDLICVTGDFFYGCLPKAGTKAEDAGVLPFFSACAALAPCYVSLGNHEWMIQPEDFSLINGTGAKILDNTFVSCDIAGAKLVIGGLTSGRVTACTRLQRASFRLLDANRYTRKAKSVPALVAGRLLRLARLPHPPVSPSGVLPPLSQRARHPPHSQRPRPWRADPYFRAGTFCAGPGHLSAAHRRREGRPPRHQPGPCQPPACAAPF